MMPQHGWTIVLWAGIAALAAVATIAGFLWLPYQEPAKQTPWEVEILPGPRPAEAESLQQPNDEYAWVDREQGTVRIPIQDAMTLAAERLSGDPAAAPSSSEGWIIPTDAGSGRYVRPPSR